jgi:hypothetical protein
MSFLSTLASAFKGGARERVPLARSFNSPWSYAFEPPPFEYRSAVARAFVDNPVAQRAVRLVAEGVGGAPLAPADHRAQALVAATSAGQGLLETLAAQLLLHAAIEGEADAPPATPADGECWLVGAAPTGEWADQAGRLATFQAGGWLFIAPRDGLRVLDRATGQAIHYRAGWQRPVTPAAPSGGTTVDSEARAAVAELVDILIASGILPQS